ncbi:hypothetical protein Ais01nite_32580 [Asanoa ishikariensis]|uniref:Phage resistance protein n=1 Tax=Asanoa ishikariensis TaxID=137265 RepID=A0A1H3UW79_9ACTN|nr:phage resistance protein [Asanoa ishikariensis]GIF65223.1 hypothetical protein Ais01nite_32580 [Asanoa ishikariensis]SDZ66684.1 hypothetical protein SAMN05421684_8262 [Asanoa ishikariensis]
MTLLRDLIEIPTSVSEGDFVVRAAGGADLGRYVVTDELRDNFSDALRRIGHAVSTGTSQAVFLHGSFGSGKSHFMAVLREILRHNPAAREVRNLSEAVIAADPWLRERTLLTLTFHMLGARSVEQAIFQGYLDQVAALHPAMPPAALHRSDALLSDAAGIRDRMGDDPFFAALGEAGGSAGAGTGLAAHVARAAGWTADTYALAAAAPPGTPQRDNLVSALTATFFSGAVRSGEFLDLDTGLAVLTRHANEVLGYDGIVLFLDELILWLSTQISDHTFVNTEGAKLNKLVESADATRPLPIVSFVARQRNLEDFLGPHVGGTEKEALAHVMRSVQGRLGEIVLADTNLPEITEKRLLKPRNDAGRATIDNAFAAVKGNREVWDTLLLGAQYGDAGIGSDASAFRRLYPFSPALVATLVALSQTLQRERTALRVMTELLVERRDTLQVNDLIGVSALFDPLVLHGDLPDRPKLRQLFQAARALYSRKLRPILLGQAGITEAEAAGNAQFQLDDKLIKTVLLGALVPEVPALHNLTAAKLHALNFGTITSPIPGYENQIVLNRLRRIRDDSGEIVLTEAPDPVVSAKLHAVDFDKLLDLVPDREAATTGVRQQILREMVALDMGLAGAEGQLGEILHQREWRGRRHLVQVKFGNVRDTDTMPVAALLATGDAWRVVIDYPFDPQGFQRSADRSRIESLGEDSRTVFWLPFYFSDEMMGRVTQLAKINTLLGGDKLDQLAADWSAADRHEGRVYLGHRQASLRETLRSALRQAYGVAAAQPADVQDDSVGVLQTIANGLRVGDPRGGTLGEAFHNLTGELLAWSYPGAPAMPEDEKPVARAELAKILEYARRAAADPTRGVTVAQADQRSVKRVCNHLRLGELVDHRYVLTMNTSRWSGHFLQRAAEDGYTERFPIHLLRSYIDVPKPFGFDSDLQNLIIAIFGLEQQLAWYEHGGKIDVAALTEVRDHYELRHPPMPTEAAWGAAVKRGQDLFGLALPRWRTPANLGEFAKGLRSAAAARRLGAVDLVRELVTHADLLGIDVHAPNGRLATARQVERLLTELGTEDDDVVVVETVAAAELAVDDAAAGQVASQAAALARELGSNGLKLLDAVAMLTTTDERAAGTIRRLRDVAAHEHHGADLATALRAAIEEATALLAGSGGTTGTPASPTGPPPPGPRPAVKNPPGGQNPHPVLPAPTPRQRLVDAASWATVADEIGKEVATGRRVTVWWTVE